MIFFFFLTFFLRITLCLAPSHSLVQTLSMKVDSSKVSEQGAGSEWLDINDVSFLAHLYFPKEYPLRPPRMKFVTEMWHPNIDQNGDGE